MIRLTDQEFNDLVGYIKHNFGINLNHKRVLLEGRLNNYLASNGYNNFTDYLAAVKKDTSGKENQNLLNKVTTNHTYFMREAEHFDYLAKVALPYWEARIPSRAIRTWCAASSSGEEPYTLAMILQDYFGSKSPAWNTALLATDISERVLNLAKEGVYAEESIEKVPEGWKQKYFEKRPDGTVQVSARIRNQVIYRIFNLMDTIKVKEPLHVIFCRNVMIYFDQPTKNAVIDRLHDALHPGGFLFLGHTESIARATRFKTVKPSVYQKEG
jgi:chemotaxis protein methyltransferase CheR